MNYFKLKDRSTISKFSYVFAHIFYGVLLSYDAYVLVDLLISPAYAKGTLMTSMLCMLLACSAGIALTYNNYRKESGIAIDVVIGMGLYIVIVFGKYKPRFMMYLFIITLLVTVVQCVFIMFGTSKPSLRVVYLRVIKCFRKVRFNLSIAALIVLVFIYGSGVLSPKRVMSSWRSSYENSAEMGEKKSEYPVDKDAETRTVKVGEKEISVRMTYGDEYRLSNNIDKIRMIRTNERFQSLSYEEKCDVIEAIIHCEARYLGLNKINIEFSTNMKYEVLGQYSHNDRTIRINANYIKSYGTAEEVLTTCIHECRHYYQYLLAELYLESSPEQRNLIAFTDLGVDSWVENIFDYKTGDAEDFIEYYYEPLEVDARAYARKTVMDFYQGIDEIDGPLQVETTAN